MIEPKPIFVILGAGGYPQKISAAGNKYFLMARALYENGFVVNLINKSGYSEKVNMITKDYIHCYFLSRKENQKFLSKLFHNIYYEIRIYRVLKKFNGKEKFLMISFCPIYNLLYYWTISKFLKYKLVFSLMEDHYNHEKKLHNKINAFLFWKFGLLLADAAIPISEYLKTKTIINNKKVPVFKLPVLANFNNVIENGNLKKGDYFLYCGSIGYKDVIDLVVEAYKRIENKKVNLYLVLHGKEKLINEYYKKVSKVQGIIILSEITESELYKLYSKSIGLLIPLRPNKQDIARFPQKIAEYLASGCPVITNNVGEIKHYFTDKINALFADDYSVESYTRAMQFILDNPHLSHRIGINGRQMGYKYFHYQSISQDLSNFILSI